MTLFTTKLVGVGNRTASVASGSATTTLSFGQSRLCRILVTTAGSVAGPVKFFDNAAYASGTLICQIPANDAVGKTYDIQMPALNGIVCQNVASGPALTISMMGSGAMQSGGNSAYDLESGVDVIQTEDGQILLLESA